MRYGGSSIEDGGLAKHGRTRREKGLNSAGDRNRC